MRESREWRWRYVSWHLDGCHEDHIAGYSDSVLKHFQIMFSLDLPSTSASWKEGIFSLLYSDGEVYCK